MTKTILAVNTEIPGAGIESVDYFSARSLLDADIVVFSPTISYQFETDTYQGRICLSDDTSFRAREAIAHWRRELAADVDAGKVVVVFLEAPQVAFAATGRIEYSGTGRNARPTRMVEALHSYGALPVNWKFHGASGTEMSPVRDVKFIQTYWSAVSGESQYEAYVTDAVEPIIKTTVGNRVVGAAARKDKGALVAVPNIEFYRDGFGQWDDQDRYKPTTAGIAFGKRYLAAIVGLADALAAEVTKTPPPIWASKDEFRIAEESAIEAAIEEITQQVTGLEERRRKLLNDLEEAGALRGLLYEQGKALEAVVLQALRLLGFEAENLTNDGSEFDAIFACPEGRCLGEIEGKDAKAINIDKLSQLERNLGEDFARDEVTEYAKGVLFGNAYRLTPASERESPFTSKCLAGAERLGIALVSTPDMFEPCRYLKTYRDTDYARECREAILSANGSVVVFPNPPVKHSAAESVVLAEG